MIRPFLNLVHPKTAEAERTTLRRQIEEDLIVTAPVWVATPGGAAVCASPTRRPGGGDSSPTHGPAAARVPFPKPRCHAEEIANAVAEHEARRA